MKIRALLISFFLFFSVFTAFAQYEEMRILQTPEEMQKFKALKVKEQLIFREQDKSKDKPYIHRYYDEAGRLKREIKGTTKKDFIYDWRNRIIMIKDSVLIGGYYERDEYEFEFSGYGLLGFSRFPYYNSSFDYNPEKRELTESTMMELDAYRIRYFRFSEDRKLIEEEFYNHDKTKDKTRKITYDSSGKVLKEDIINYHKYGAKDTITVNYHYNNKGQLVNKISTEIALVFPTEYDEEPLIPVIETSGSTYTYSYDAAGNLLEEQFAYNDKSFGYRIVYEYNDKGLIISQKNYNIQEELQQSLIYKYKFRK